MNLNLIKCLLLLLLCLSRQLLAEEEYWEYTFTPGDSIWKIAQEHTSSVDNWKEIQQLNRIRQGPDRKIQPGTRIIIPVSMLKLQPVAAKVIAVKGTALLRRANGDELQPRIGTLLYSGDRLITAEKQNISIQFADESQLQLLSGSEVIFDKLSYFKKSGMVDTRIRLESGRIDTRVEKLHDDSHYQIKTPVAITAVRGTAYRISADDQLSRTEVTDGVVNVSAGNTEINVEKGYGLVAEKGQALTPPVKLLSQPRINLRFSADRQEVHLSWQALAGVSYYRYQLANDEHFNGLSVDMTTVNNEIELTGLQPAHYFLRVRGVDRQQLQGLDAVVDFNISPRADTDDMPKNDSLPAAILLLNL